MSLVRMVHEKRGKLLVPPRKVAQYEKQGWRRDKSGDQPAKKAAPVAAARKEGDN